MLSFALVCVLCGAVVMNAVHSHYAVQEAQVKAQQLEKDVFKCADAVHEYINDRTIIMRQFADMEARFTRMEHLMHIPRAERHGAWKAMVDEQ